VPAEVAVAAGGATELVVLPNAVDELVVMANTLDDDGGENLHRNPLAVTCW
jgi:hypothetical protein